MKPLTLQSILSIPGSLPPEEEVGVTHSPLPEPWLQSQARKHLLHSCSLVSQYLYFFCSFNR